MRCITSHSERNEESIPHKSIWILQSLHSFGKTYTILERHPMYPLALDKLIWSNIWSLTGMKSLPFGQ